jgi:uncharacterized membrane protein YgdD (TMEM256/DUF423 family)
MSRTWIRWGSFFMLTGVIAGAFGAHALKNSLSEPAKMVYETAVRYQLIHGLGLFVVAWLATQSEKKFVTWAGVAFCSGIILFSGSLYVLAFTGIRSFGAVTPLGGVCFLIGWGCVLRAGTVPRPYNTIDHS